MPLFFFDTGIVYFFPDQKITVDPKSKSAGARIFKAVSPRRIKQIQHIYNRPHI